jgi:hypothetical protein
LQSWSDLEWYKYGDDRHGMLAYFGHEPTPADLARCFEGTSAGTWGDIFRGTPAGGIYAGIISGIKRYGIKDFVDNYYGGRSSLRYKRERHLRAGRRVRQRAEKERKRLPHEEPIF